ncbi:MAG: hypothetical protein V3U54_13175 [Thermodesulfobacteriota bacterium]
MEVTGLYGNKGKGTYTEKRKESIDRYRKREKAKVTAFEKTLELMARNEELIPDNEKTRFFKSLTKLEMQVVIGWLKNY